MNDNLEFMEILLRLSALENVLIKKEIIGKDDLLNEMQIITDEVIDMVNKKEKK